MAFVFRYRRFRPNISVSVLMHGYNVEHRNTNDQLGAHRDFSVLNVEKLLGHNHKVFTR